VDDFAFVRSTLTVEATLRARGFGREDVQVLLKREGQVVAQATLKLEPGKETYTVPLSFAPDTPARSCSPSRPRSCPGGGGREQLPLLRPPGHPRPRPGAARRRAPSWDERFLRGLLKQDPNVDLVSFFILRTAGDNPGPAGPALPHPLPVAESSGRQLRTFDAVIFSTSPTSPTGARHRALPPQPARLRPRRRSVRDGGGGQSFARDTMPGRPSPTSWRWTRRGNGRDLRALRPRLTRRAGATRSRPSRPARRPTRPPGRAPPLPGLNFTRPLSPTDGARVLLEAPTLLGGRPPAPVVAVREVERDAHYPS